MTNIQQITHILDKEADDHYMYLVLLGLFETSTIVSYTNAPELYGADGPNHWFDDDFEKFLDSTERVRVFLYGVHNDFEW